MTTATDAVTLPSAGTPTSANGTSGPPRRPASPGLPRRQVAERLRERRAREEALIVSALDALGRRAAALDEVAAAGQALSSAIRDLEVMGFSRDDLAQVLDVAAGDLEDVTPAGKKGSRPRAGK